MDDDKSDYKTLEEVDSNGIRLGMQSLTLFDSDMNLTMQAVNLNIVDTILTDMEYETLRMHRQEDPEAYPQMALQAALAQMWIFSAYEIMRTWRQRVTNIKKWADNGGLQVKLENFRAKSKGEFDIGSEIRISQLESVIKNPNLIAAIDIDLKRTHYLFNRLEAIRIMLAKHEMPKKGKKSSDVFPVMPGYGGRLNGWCGSLEYDLGNAQMSIGFISRRDIADTIRYLGESSIVPTDSEIASFDAMMDMVFRGTGVEFEIESDAG